MRFVAVLSMVAMAASVVGCGGMSEEDAKRAFAAASAVTSGGQSQAALGGSALTMQAAETTSFSFPCPQGGDAAFDGSYSADQFDFAVAYRACKTQQISIDGDLDFAMSSASDATGTTATFDYNGDLSFDGEVSGDCEIAVTGVMTIAAGGNSFSASSHISGSLCGNDVNYDVSSSGSY